jgi:citrate lyase alpha subunit
MQLKNESLGVSFDIPDVLTGTLRAAWTARKDSGGVITNDTLYPRLWYAAVPLINNWVCDCVTPGQSMDEMTTDRQFRVVQFVVLEVGSIMRAAEELPKNA